MLDHFDDKRGVLKKLLEMLKEHASNEVKGGLKAPEGMPEGATKGIQVEKVMVADHDMDHSTPEHDVETKELSHGGAIMDKPASEGEYVDAPHKAIPYESAEGHPDEHGAVQKEASEGLDEREGSEDSGPEVNGSPFDNFLRPLKKRKSPMR